MSEFKRAIEWDMICGNYPTGQELTDDFTKLAFSLVVEEYEDELKPYFLDGNLIEVFDAIGDMLKVLSQLAYSLEVNPEELFRVVNDSNYTKFCYNEDDAIASVKSYENDERYHSVYYDEIDGTYVIFGYKTGMVPGVDKPKVLKGIHFQEPNISQFVKKA